jgi:hypothetical protein
MPYDKTVLWQSALGARIEDSEQKERDRLRVGYENVRMRAMPVAEAIKIDLPEFTVHDITHLDALWEIADQITGKNYPINPCEAFVLGCSFLIHDLGMGLAAYPDGLVGLKRLDLWRDTAADVLKKSGAMEITDASIKKISGSLEKMVISETLRRLHAVRAEKLALTCWTTPGTDARFFLIEDPELRDAFGPTIGRIAASHWWPTERLEKEFSTITGAQVGFPPNWTIDPLKLACILRCADFAHIDERRAPAFLRALRKPEGVSAEHWKFQAKLYQPRIEGDRLVYTAKSGFSVEDSGAWWVCFDTLNSIDTELRKVDSLLADTGRARFVARGVSQADEPARLAKLITTDGWQPIDTRIRVSAVADLVSKLGGKDLYGDAITPPLREMIQNAADAIRARRLVDDRASDWGEIRITTGKDSTGVWIQVEDTGVGMSEAVLTGPLLDFGTSFWSSPMMRDELPGLSSKGFQATGRYGIGFFSVFMWGSRIDVVTQRFDKGRDDTIVLSFKKGLNERPLLRNAVASEFVTDGGTRVKIWFNDDEILEKLTRTYDDKKKTLTEVCAELAPCLDVTLKAKLAGSTSRWETAVAANDWLSIPQKTLMKRISSEHRPWKKRATVRGTALAPCPTMKIIKDTKGVPMGRVALWSSETHYLGPQGVVTVGGLRACRLEGIAGVFVGAPKRASRDAAIPIIPIDLVKKWAATEIKHRQSEGNTSGALASMAGTVVALGVEPQKIPIARAHSGWISLEKIESLAKSIDEFIFASDGYFELFDSHVASIELNKNVLLMPGGISTVLQGESRWIEWPPLENIDMSLFRRRYYPRSIQASALRALARAWKCTLDDIIKCSTFFKYDDDENVHEIGKIGGKPYLEQAEIIRRPKKGSRSGKANRKASE